MPARERRKAYPEKKPNPCPDGCELITHLGSNAFVKIITCLECGHLERRKIDDKPTCAIDDCPHDDIDHRGWAKKTKMYWCTKFCTFIGARDRGTAKAAEKQATKFAISSSSQQQAVSRILAERELNKEQAIMVVGITYTGMVTEAMKTRETITSTQLVAILEDTIDLTLTPALTRDRKRAPDKTAMMGYGDEDEAYKNLPMIDVYEDPGIWVCLDEGCSSNCHGDEWVQTPRRRSRGC